MKRNKFLGGSRLKSGCQGEKAAKILVPAFLTVVFLFSGCLHTGGKGDAGLTITASPNLNLIQWAPVAAAKKYTVTRRDFSLKSYDKGYEKSWTTENTWYADKDLEKGKVYQYSVALSATENGTGTFITLDTKNSGAAIKYDDSTIVERPSKPAIVGVFKLSADPDAPSIAFRENDPFKEGDPIEALGIGVKGLKIGYSYYFQLQVKSPQRTRNDGTEYAGDPVWVTLVSANIKPSDTIGSFLVDQWEVVNGIRGVDADNNVVAVNGIRSFQVLSEFDKNAELEFRLAVSYQPEAGYFKVDPQTGLTGGYDASWNDPQTNSRTYYDLIDLPVSTAKRSGEILPL
jgi:hypothetical protein